MAMNISKNNNTIAMKKYFYFGLFIMVFNSRSEAQGFGGLKGKNTYAPDTSVLKSKIMERDFYKATFLNISETDIKQELNYYDAQKACTNLGEEWRLPTLDELDMIFKVSKENYTSNFGNNFANTYYWTSTEYNRFNAWVLLPKDDSNFYGKYSEKDFYKQFFGKSNKFNVRAVKLFTFDVLIENPKISLKYNEINSIVIGLGDGWRIPSKYELRMLEKNIRMVEKDRSLQLRDNYYISDEYFYFGEDPDKNSRTYKKIILIRDVK